MQSPITRPSSSPVLSLTWGQKLKEMVALKTSTIDPAQRENIAKFLRCDPVKIRTAYDSEIAAMIIDATRYPSKYALNYDVELELSGLDFTGAGSCEFPDNITLNNCTVSDARISFARGVVHVGDSGCAELRGPGEVYADGHLARAVARATGAHAYASGKKTFATAHGEGATATASKGGSLDVYSGALGFVRAGSHGKSHSGATVIAVEATANIKIKTDEVYTPIDRQKYELRGCLYFLKPEFRGKTSPVQTVTGKGINFAEWSNLNETGKGVAKTDRARFIENRVDNKLSIQSVPRETASSVISSGSLVPDYVPGKK